MECHIGYHPEGNEIVEETKEDNLTEERTQKIASAHEEVGHAGAESTYIYLKSKGCCMEEYVEGGKRIYEAAAVVAASTEIGGEASQR